MVTRRGLLRQAGALAAVGGVAATAGCNGGGDGTATDGTPVPSYASRLYDPTAVLDDPAAHGFLAYDVGALYRNRDVLPDETVSQVEEFDDGTDLVDLSGLDRLAGQVYADRTPAEVRRAASGPAAAGGTAVLTGSFDPDRLASTLRESSPSATVEEVGSAAGHTLYTVEGSGTPAAVALSEESVGLGATTPETDPTGESALRTALTTDGGYYDGDDTAATLMDALGEGVATGGMVGDFGTVFAEEAPDWEGAEPTATGLEALGSSVSLDGGRMTSTVAGVYAEGERPAESDLRALVDRVGELAAEADGVSVPADDVEATVEGRAATLSLTQNPDVVFDFERFGGAPVPGGLELAVLAFVPGLVAVLGFVE